MSQMNQDSIKMHKTKRQAIEGSNIPNKRTPYWIENEVAPFESLPPEIIVNILKMAMKSGYACSKHQHNFLLDIISEVSKKFKDVAAIKSLWAGEVFLWGGEAKIKKVIANHLNDRVSGLELEGELERSNSDVTITTDILQHLSVKCPTLRTLTLSNLILLGTWPTFAAPWMSLKKLEIREGPMVSVLFVDVQIHRDLPNLEEFAWVCSGPLFRPRSVPEESKEWRKRMEDKDSYEERTLELGKCENLRSIKLCHKICQKVINGFRLPRVEILSDCPYYPKFCHPSAVGYRF